MLRRVAGYLRTNALGAAALFIALGGAALAATHASPYVAPNGTVHACVSRGGGVTFAKVGKPCGRRTSLVVLNQKGVRGARGLPGIPGPTEASASDQNTSDSPPASGAAQAPGADMGTIVTKTKGRLLITASGESFIACSPSGGCSNTYGLYVDGHPVPHTEEVVSAEADKGTNYTPFYFEGLTGVLPAGTHAYTVMVKHSQYVIDGDAFPTHLWAVLVGG